MDRHELCQSNQEGTVRIASLKQIILPMNIQTWSILAGTTVCNARCPFCVSQMTPTNGMKSKPITINWRNFHKSARFAQINNVSTVFLTGKGEPTLFLDQITKYLVELEKYSFPIIDLQTNGSRLLDLGESALRAWYKLGLTTIAISVVHYEDEVNRKIYFPERKTYFDIKATVALLKEIGFNVRLSVILFKGGLDSPASLEKFLSVTKAWGVDQITFRPVAMPTKSENVDVAAWTEAHILSYEERELMSNYIASKGTAILELMHGAKVYDIDGQNVCFSSGLTHDTSGNEMRQIITFPDGTLRYSWSYTAAKIF